MISSLKSIIKLFGDEFRNYLHELVYLQPCLPSPAMALSLEWNMISAAPFGLRSVGVTLGILTSSPHHYIATIQIIRQIVLRTIVNLRIDSKT
jgi:hypothetical protein